MLLIQKFCLDNCCADYSLKPKSRQLFVTCQAPERQSEKSQFPRRFLASLKMAIKVQGESFDQGFQEYLHNMWVEMFAHLFADVGERVFLGPRSTVGTFARKGIPYIHNREDAC